MAWLYKRSKSPFYWIGFSKKLGRPPESTGLRWDDPIQVRQANEILRLAQAEEQTSGKAGEKFANWINQFIDQRYSGSPGNLKSYRNRWKALSAFLNAQGVEYPRDILPTHIPAYISWRTGDGHRNSGIRRARKNTAIEELKFLRMVMRYAVSMGYVYRSVIEGIRVPWEAQKEKPEIAEADLPRIWQALEQGPEWMRVQFQIAYYTGCRLGETNVPLRCVDLNRMEMYFPLTKGDKPRTVPLPKPLLPLFSRLKRERGEGATAFTPDCNPHTMSVRWCHFFKALGMPYSFHCLRVSFVSRCARSGLPEPQVMRIVGHESASVHRIYLRIQASDLRAAVDAIAHSSLGGGEIQGGPAATP
jgi:integrase